MQDYRTLDSEQFHLDDCVIAGTECVLIHPKQLDAAWTPETLCYRSVIVEKVRGAFISCGFPKFLNLGQSPHLYPDPTHFTDWTVEDKLDGSLIIVSRFKGEVIVRTRGTVSAFVHESGPELATLLAANPLITDNAWANSEEWSLLFEHCSPTNRIVLAYQEPSLTLLGAVHHSDYALMNDLSLSIVAKTLGVRRPEQFTFGSIADIVATCEHLKGREGFVLSYGNHAHRVKIKAQDYLLRHRLKSELGSLSKVLDLYMAHLEMPTLPCGCCDETLYDYIARTFDYEIAQQVKPFVTQIEAAHFRVNAIIADVQREVEPLMGLSRKCAADSIISRYREAGLSGLGFILLDKRSIPNKTLRELIERNLATP